MLPLTLGEGRGEDIAEQCKDYSPSFFGVLMREERTKGWVVSLSPRPNPLPNGEGTLRKLTYSELPLVCDRFQLSLTKVVCRNHRLKSLQEENRCSRNSRSSSPAQT